MAKRTKRIYYGPNGGAPYWTVRVSNAKKGVVINGNAAHALRGQAGETIGCAISNMAHDPENASAFPHPVHLVVVTKSTLLAVDKVGKDKVPLHAVLYDHRYGHVVDDNDTRVIKKMVAENPALMNRPFKLLVPHKQRSGVYDARVTHDRGTNRAKAVMNRGALQRAYKAGFVGKGAKQQMEDVAAA